MSGNKQTNSVESAFASASAGDLKALCYCMSTCEDFHLNTKALAPLIGISASNNVPRKIKSIIEPLGFELKAGKVYLKGASGAPGNNEESGSGPSTPVKPQKAGGVKTPAPKRATKKRKLQAAADDDAHDEDEADEAKKPGSDGKDQDEA
ncbi:uncharacterized protein PG986_002674 [Apiospora aurea]|uniref:Uncharacterized protein n=1 Tax=Apiospora aurea TaxID=335848 RepID=A0ABR1QPI7_9PEZI